MENPFLEAKNPFLEEKNPFIEDTPKEQPKAQLVIKTGDLDEQKQNMLLETVKQNFKMHDSVVGEAVKPAPTPEAPKNNPRVKDTYRDDIFGDLARHADSVGIDVADFATAFGRVPIAMVLGLKTELEGKSQEQAVEVFDNFMKDSSLRRYHPDNEENSYVGKALGTAMEPIAGTAKSLLNFNPMDFMAGLAGDEEAASKLTKPDDINPLATRFAEENAGLILAAKGAKAIKDSAIEGKSTRINTDSGDLPPPPKSPTPIEQIAEQKAFSENAKKELLDNYNKKPGAFGVDESGAKNPYLYSAFDDIMKAESQPKLLTGPSYSQRHAKMVEKGDAVIADMDAKGLSPRDVNKTFWEETYPMLPDEVQTRFQRLLNRQTKKAGGDLMETAMGYRLPSTTATLERMDRWYVALMHEANNTPWTPQAEKVIEHRADIQEIKDDLVGYVDRTNIPPAEASGAVDQTIFNTKDVDIYDKYIDTVIQNSKQEGGSLNTILDFIEKNSDSPLEKTLAALLRTKEDIKVILFDIPKTTKFGEANLTNPLDPYIKLYIDTTTNRFGGISVQTILHEALHHVVGGILELGRDSETRKIYPEYARFTDEIHNLWLQISQQALSDPQFQNQWYLSQVTTGGSLESYGAPGHEFMTYGMTNPEFRNYVLRQFIVDPSGKVFPRTVSPQAKEWADYMEAMRNPLTKDAFSELVELTLPILQATQGASRPLADLVSVFRTKRGGWWDNHEVFSPKKEKGLVEKAKDFLTKPIPWPKAEAEPILYHIVNKKTGKVVGKARTKEGARNAVDRHDNKYGAYVHGIEAVDPSAELGLFIKPKGFYSSSANGLVDIKPQHDAPPAPQQPPRNFPKLTALDFLIAKWPNYHAMQQDLKHSMYEYKDLNPITGNIYSTLEVKGPAQNPVITFATTQIRRIYGDTQTLKGVLIKSIQEFIDAPKDSQNRVVDALNQINRPETQDLLIQARATNPTAYGPDILAVTDQELFHYGNGMLQADVDLYRRTLEPLFKTLLKIDDAYLTKGFGRELKTKVVGYFPRSFGHGKFILEAWDPAQGMDELAFFHRYRTFAEMRAQQMKLEAAGLLTNNSVSKDFTSYKAHLLALVQLDRHTTASKVAQRTIEAAEEHRRTQEFERNARGVAGFIGQERTNPKELRKLVEMIIHRIDQTTEVYKAARMLNEILRPIRGDVLAQLKYPNAVKWVNDFMNREMGGDISEVPVLIDGNVHKGLNWSYKQILKHTDYGKFLRAGEIVVNPMAAKEGAKYVTALASAWTLVLNVPNLVINLTSVPLISLLGGFPDSVQFKVPLSKLPTIAIRAHLESMWDAGQMALGRADPQVYKLMNKAKDRGLISASAYDDIPHMKADIEKGPIQRGFDWALNVPRSVTADPIEHLTNWSAFLYYNRFVKIAWPNLPEKQHFERVEALAKKYTADYRRLNRSLGIDKLGILGQSISNFMTWMLTRLSQSHHITKEVLQGRVLPFMALVTATVLTAGIQGMPFMQDYENIRQMGMDLAKKDAKVSWDLPPVDKALKDIGAPRWIRDGVVLNATGLDLASRGKWAGFTDIGGITWQMPGKVANILSWSYHEYFPHGTMGIRNKGVVGHSLKEDADYIKSIPPVLQGLAREKHMTRKFSDKPELSFISGHGDRLYGQNENAWFDKWANRLNFKTVKQADETKEFYNTQYAQKSYKNEITDLKAAGLKSLLQSISERRKGNIKRADELQSIAKQNFENYIKTAKDPGGFDRFAADIKKGIADASDPPDVRIAKELVRTNSGGRILMLLDSLKRTRESQKEFQPQASKPGS